MRWMRLKRSAETVNPEEVQPPKKLPKIAVFNYGGSLLKSTVAPDFTDITDVERNGNITTIHFHEGTVEVPSDKIIVVRRVTTDESN